MSGRGNSDDEELGPKSPRPLRAAPNSPRGPARAIPMLLQPGHMAQNDGKIALSSRTPR